MNELSWNVFSGGSVTIDLERCVACPTKACIAACNVPNLGSALAAGPDGLGALTFALPTPEIDAYLDALRAAGGAPGRGW